MSHSKRTELANARPDEACKRRRALAGGAASHGGERLYTYIYKLKSVHPCLQQSVRAATSAAQRGLWGQSGSVVRNDIFSLIFILRPPFASQTASVVR